MAFHVACPITCRRICDCELGFPEGLRGGKAREDWWDQIEALQDFLLDPWSVRPAAEAGPTVQVPVPKVEPPPAPPPQAAVAVAAVEDGEDAQHKHAALQRQAIAASAAAEDYVRKLEAGGATAATATDFLGEEAGDFAKEDHGSKVMCRMCFSGENEGSYRAEKMLSCKICNKKYHRSCLKSWAAHRDLFHWSSWACPSCRICEVCRRAGDPTKFMYCKRCDGAYHCYCQQPPHKNVSQGPYLCPKHTRCHSCGSTVPGSGLSTRWFLGYTCCDACGRLFTKGNYCPVCLKVYRDSETTPMVCCDDCERWVHCSCDGISDEKYQQFQSDQNLQYRCPACRGDCYQFANMEDAVRELWNRRDEADRDLISGLRAAAGLPSKEEIFCISPYSDDEQSGPVVLKNENGRSWKFSLKGLGDKSAKNSKEHGKSVSKTSNKKSAKKKGYRIKFVGKVDESYQNYERQDEEKALESNFKDTKFDDINLYKTDVTESVLSSLTKSSGNGRVKSRVEQLGSGTFNRGSRMECVDGKLQGPDFKEYAATNTSKNDNVKGTKIVIHLGGRNRNVSSSPRSENSSFHKDQDLAASHGSEDTSQLKPKDSNSHAFEAHAGVARHDGAQHDEGNQGRSSKHGDTKKNVIKLGKISDIQRKTNGNTPEDSKPMASLRSPVLGNRSMEVDSAVETEAKPMTHDAILKKGAAATLRNDSHDNSRRQTVSGASNDPKPLLRLKFKNPYMEQRSSWAPRGEEENSVKGQRSKRKRCSTEKLSSVHEDDSHSQQQVENSIDKVMDANWILQKLGKDAIGKRVEVHQSSDNSWHKGVVSNLIGGSSSLSVQLDDGRLTTLELGKQGVRFVSQKQKKAKR